jgi:hypothetical protein
VGEVAAIAASCVKMKAEDRPTMRQMEMTLESIQASVQRIVQHTGTNICDEKQKAVMYPLPEGTSKQEPSRQYSLEEEFLLSARYPR